MIKPVDFIFRKVIFKNKIRTLRFAALVLERRDRK
jgi:hypothetical protein